MSPAQRRGETFEALRRLLVRAAERRPQVLVIEDLHWIDSASEQFLATLVDSVPALRVLLVFTYRPGYANPFGERSYFTRVVPAPLSADDSARMAAAVLAADALPDELRALVGDQGRGQSVLRRGAGQVAGGERARCDGRAAGSSSPGPWPSSPFPARSTTSSPRASTGSPRRPSARSSSPSVIGREFTRRLVDRLAEIRERTDGLPARADRARADPRAPAAIPSWRTCSSTR